MKRPLTLSSSSSFFGVFRSLIKLCNVIVVITGFFAIYHVTGPLEVTLLPIIVFSISVIQAYLSVLFSSISVGKFSVIVLLHFYRRVEHYFIVHKFYFEYIITTKTSPPMREKTIISSNEAIYPDEYQ